MVEGMEESRRIVSRVFVDHGTCMNGAINATGWTFGL